MKTKTCNRCNQYQDNCECGYPSVIEREKKSKSDWKDLLDLAIRNYNLDCPKCKCSETLASIDSFDVSCPDCGYEWKSNIFFEK